jgi:peptidoglycan-associated lipoprotein
MRLIFRAFFQRLRSAELTASAQIQGRRVLALPLALTIAMGLTMSAGCSRNVKPDATDSAAATAPEGSPQIADAPMNFDAQGSDSGRIDGLATVFFDYDRANLSEESRAKLAGNADWMRRNPRFTLQIEGHTDSRGSTEYNLALGERRAKAVKTYLEGLGIPADRMNIISFGEDKPLADGDSESAFARNRRANFVPVQ